LIKQPSAMIWRSSSVSAPVETLVFLTLPSALTTYASNACLPERIASRMPGTNTQSPSA